MATQGDTALGLYIQATRTLIVLCTIDKVQGGIGLAFTEESSGVEMARVMVGAIHGEISFCMKDCCLCKIRVQTRPDERLKALREE